MSQIKEKPSKAISILQAAEKLFNKYGYKKVSIDEIVKAANIAKGTFYLYFNHKHDLYSQIIDTYFKKKNEYTKRAISDVKKGDKEKIFESMLGNLAFLINTPILREIFMNNPNYITEKLTKTILFNKNLEIIQPLMSKFNIRKDIHLSCNQHENCKEFDVLPLLLATYKTSSVKKFWEHTENLLKIWIDGLTSEYKWKNKSASSIVNSLKKDFGV